MNWTEIGEKAFNWYFNMYRKTESHDEAQDMVEDDILYALEDADIELENLWYQDEQVPEEAIIEFGIAFLNKMKGINEEVGYEVDGELLAVMHTWLDGVTHQCAEHKDYANFAKLSGEVVENL